MIPPFLFCSQDPAETLINLKHFPSFFLANYQEHDSQFTKDRLPFVSARVAKSFCHFNPELSYDYSPNRLIGKSHRVSVSQSCAMGFEVFLSLSEDEKPWKRQIGKIEFSQGLLKNGYFSFLMTRKVEKEKFLKQQLIQKKNFAKKFQSVLQRIIDYAMTKEKLTGQEINVEKSKNYYNMIKNLVLKGAKSNYDEIYARIQWMQSKDLSKVFSYELREDLEEIKALLYLKSDQRLILPLWAEVENFMKNYIYIEEEENVESYELRMAKRQYHQDKASYQKVKVDFFPDLRIGTSAHIPIYPEDNSHKSSFWSAKVSVSIKPVEWWDSPQFQEAEVVLQKSFQMFVTERRKMNRERKQANRNRKNLKGKINFQKEILKLKAAVLAAEKIKYQRGKSSLSDVYEKEDDLRKGRQKLLQHEASYLKSQLTYHYTTGQLLKIFYGKELVFN